MGKIKNIANLVIIVQDLRKQGKKIVTTNGVFDILHPAHFRFLAKARSMGDCLIVLVNNDVSVERFKGNRRPIFGAANRAYNLSCIESVNYVVIFNEDTPLSVLRLLRPDIHAKGGSFIPERIKQEQELIESWGGRLATFPLEKGYSTTSIINKILNAHKN